MMVIPKLKPWAAALLAAATLSASACATLRPTPAQGGPPWRELTSEHFRLRTDVPEREARELIRRLEEHRAGMLATVWPQATGAPTRIDVVALGGGAQVHAYLGPYRAGLRGNRPPLGATLVTADLRNDESDGVLRHELAHELAHWSMPFQPPWYAEGVAMFLQTLTYDRDAQEVRVGMVARRPRQTLAHLSLLPARELLSARSVSHDQQGARFEATAWLLMQYLMNQMPQELASLQQRMARLEPPDQAWAAAMPQLGPEALDRALEAYRRHQQYWVAKLPLVVPEPRVSVRAMSDAEVHGVRALVFDLGARGDDAVALARIDAEVKEALRLEPGAIDASVEAFYALTSSRDERRLADIAGAAVRAHPDRWVAWVMAADAAPAGGPERRKALERAVALGPAEPGVLTRMAVLEAREGRWAEALAFTSRALRLHAMSWELLSLHAQALTRTGRCNDAAFFRRAVAANTDPEAGGKRTASASGAADLAADAGCSTRAPPGSP